MSYKCVTVKQDIFDKAHIYIYIPRCESSLDEVKTWLIKVLYDFSELSVSLLHSSLIAVKSNLHDTSLATSH